MEMMEALEALLSIESVTQNGEGGYPYGSGPARALDCALDICRSLGFRTYNQAYRYGYAEIGEGEDLLLILCHLDVVPAGDGWDTPPFQACERNGRIYARGAIDDKGPAIASIYAMKDILDSGVVLGKRIRILFGQSEENGNWTDIDDYRSEQEQPVAGFTPDAEFPAIYGEKGIGIVKVTMPLEKSGLREATGGNAPNMVPDYCRLVMASGAVYDAKGQSAHGSTPWEGENAIAKATGAALDAGEQGSFLIMVRDLFTDDHDGRRAGIYCCDEESGGLTLNPGLLETDREQAVLTLDIRYPVKSTLDEVLAALNARLSAYGAVASIGFHIPKLFQDKNGDILQALLAAYHSESGDDTEPLVIGGASYARAMENIVAFGPLYPGQEKTEHGANEYVTMQQMKELRRIYAKALRNLLALQSKEKPMKNRENAVITVVGKDRTGILATVSARCAEENANVVEMTQSVMEEYFTLIMLIDITDLNVTLDVFGADLREELPGMDVHVMHERIFEVMHRI